MSFEPKKPLGFKCTFQIAREAVVAKNADVQLQSLVLHANMAIYCFASQKHGRPRTQTPVGKTVRKTSGPFDLCHTLDTALERRWPSKASRGHSTCPCHSFLWDASSLSQCCLNKFSWWDFSSSFIICDAALANDMPTIQSRMHRPFEDCTHGGQWWHCWNTLHSAPESSVSDVPNLVQMDLYSVEPLMILLLAVTPCHTNPSTTKHFWKVAFALNRNHFPCWNSRCFPHFFAMKKVMAFMGFQEEYDLYFAKAASTSIEVPKMPKSRTLPHCNLEVVKVRARLEEPKPF